MKEAITIYRVTRKEQDCTQYLEYNNRTIEEAYKSQDSNSLHKIQKFEFRDLSEFVDWVNNWYLDYEFEQLYVSNCDSELQCY